MRKISSEEAAKILNVEIDIDISSLNKVWRNIAKTCHPDLYKNNKNAERKFKKLNNAYNTLLKIKESIRRQHDLEDNIIDNEFERWIAILDPEKQKKIKQDLDNINEEKHD